MTYMERKAHDAAKASGDRSVQAGELSFDVARTIEDVAQAWQLVYRAYLRTGLIHANPTRIHTVPQAIGRNTVVVCGRVYGRIVSTLSGYVDGPQSLPLDSVYAAQLDALRAAGCRLMEVGLFADRRLHLERSREAILELMRYVCYFGVHAGATDAVIGVHPHHAAYYTRLLGFDVSGPIRRYGAVNEAEVVLLRLDWYGKVGGWQGVETGEMSGRVESAAKGVTGEHGTNGPNDAITVDAANDARGRKRCVRHRALARFRSQPVPAEMYRDRFRFEPDVVGGSVIGEVMRQTGGVGGGGS